MRGEPFTSSSIPRAVAVSDAILPNAPPQDGSDEVFSRLNSPARTFLVSCRVAADLDKQESKARASAAQAAPEDHSRLFR